MTPPSRTGTSALTTEGLAGAPVAGRRTALALVALSIAVAALLTPLVRGRSVRALPRRPAAATAEHAATPGSRPMTGREWFVAPGASAAAAGDLSHPLSLEAVLSAAGPVRPGDVIWLRGGRYSGSFHSQLQGTADRPIAVASYPGEHAVLDGGSHPESVVLRVDGAHTEIRDLEVTNSAPSEPGRTRGTGVDVFGAGTRLVNLIVHDTGNGVGVWTPAVGAEVYGCLIYSVGWEADDRGHGHSIYIQNDTETKRVVDNVMFGSHSYGVHAYTSLGQINNLHFEGNIAFDHGTPSPVSGAKANFLVGGTPIAHAPVLLFNYAYYPWRSTGRNADVGYIAGCVNATLRGNYLAGGTPIVLTRCTNVEMSDNHFIGDVDASTAARFPANEYRNDRPAEPAVFVRPNRYERGRGHVAVFNWGRRATVRLDVSALHLQRGEAFEVRDVRDYFGPPVATGSGGRDAIDLPVPRLPGAAGAGDPAEFAAFVVLPQRSVARTFASRAGREGRGGRP